VGGGLNFYEDPTILLFAAELAFESTLLHCQYTVRQPQAADEAELRQQQVVAPYVLVAQNNIYSIVKGEQNVAERNKYLHRYVGHDLHLCPPFSR
jgi:hypothetical protein